MTLTPTPVVLRQMVDDCSYLFEPIRRHYSLETQQRILSVFYFVADEKCLMLRLQDSTALWEALCPGDYVVRQQIMEELVPKVFRLADYIRNELLKIMHNPDARPDPTFEHTVKFGFSENHTQILIGYKKGFFGGMKPDIRHIPIPLIMNIEKVLWC